MLSEVLGLFSPRVPDEDAVRNFLGRFGMRRRGRTALVRLNKTPHASVIGTTGSGKNRCLITPFLMTCPDACVVIDVKGGESAKLTAHYRAKKFGHKHRLLDPFKQVTQAPDTLNVLEFIKKDSLHALNDCDEVAHAIVEHKQEHGDGLHFIHKAQEIIATAVAGAVQLGTTPVERSLPTVCTVLSGPETWETALGCMLRAGGAWSGMLGHRAASLGHLKDRELASAMSTVIRFLHFLLSPAIQASTLTSTFDPDELNDGKTDVYLILEPNRVETLTPLVRLYVGCLLRAVFRRGLQENNLVHFICDEAYSLGEFKPLATALTVGRGYGIRMSLFYQDLAEVMKCWPEGGHRTLLANTSQVYLRVNDLETAKMVSEAMGPQTIMVSDYSTTTGWSVTCAANPQNSSTSRSGNESEGKKPHQRNLMNADEVMRLPQGLAITRVPGMAPICLRLLNYDEESFEDKPTPKDKVLLKAIVILLLALIPALGMSVYMGNRYRKEQEEAKWRELLSQEPPEGAKPSW